MFDAPPAPDHAAMDYIEQTLSVLAGDVMVALRTPRFVVGGNAKNKRQRHCRRRREQLRSDKCFSVVAVNGRSLSSGDDSVDYVVTFHEPMSLHSARRSVITVTYRGNKRCEGTITIPLWPADDGAAKRSEMTLKTSSGDDDDDDDGGGGGDLVYWVFATHQLQITRAADGGGSSSIVVSKLFFKAENNQISKNAKAAEIIMQSAVDMGSLYLRPQFGDRYVPLDFFPPDVDPAQYGLVIDPAQIRQDSVLWFQLRTEVSGSKSYKLLGFFVPPKDSAKGRNWTYYTNEFDTSNIADSRKRERAERDVACRKRLMRFGTLSEDVCVVAYLTAFPKRVFYQRGVCSPPPERGFRANWGASPDGLVIDPDMTWDDPQLRKYAAPYRDAVPRMDPTRGAVEFKCTRGECTMRDYYLPQAYMEMFALDTMWCDVVRYSRTSARDNFAVAAAASGGGGGGGGARGRWIVMHTFRVYRVYRHHATERQLKECLEEAYDDRESLQTVVGTEKFVALRKYFVRLAERIPYTELKVTEDMARAFEDYEKLRKRIASNGLPIPDPNDIPAASAPEAPTGNANDDGDGGVEFWERMYERMDVLHQLYKTTNREAAEGGGDGDSNARADFVHQAAEHIEDYGKLIRMVLN